MTSWSSTTRARATFSPWEIRSLPPHHAVVEGRDAQGHTTPPMVVHFDLAFTAALTARQREALWGPAPPAEITRPILGLLRTPPPAAPDVFLASRRRLAAGRIPRRRSAGDNARRRRAGPRGAGR